jgi:MarR family transcriptional regulator, lower aerobic nicotinate degradation pathway regulator
MQRSSTAALPAVGYEFSSPFALGMLLREAHERVARTMDHALRPFGIERRHLMVLMRLAGEGVLTQRDLVERTRHDKASIMRIVDDLERLGLAVREPVPGDRRLRAVTMTEHGQDVLHQAREAAHPVARASTEPLTSDQALRLKELLRAYLAD